MESNIKRTQVYFQSLRRISLINCHVIGSSAYEEKLLNDRSPVEGLLVLRGRLCDGIYLLLALINLQNSVLAPRS